MSRSRPSIRRTSSILRRIGLAARRLSPCLITALLASSLSAQQDFLRGDFDRNGEVEPFVDFAYFALNFDLAGQTISTSCEDALDFDDNGFIDGNDALGLIIWWNTGLGPVPAPGVLACGPDPSADPLDCAIESCTPGTTSSTSDASVNLGAMTGSVLEVLQVPITLTHSRALVAFQFSVCHDPALVELLSVTPGPDHPLFPIEYDYVHLDPSGGGFELGYSVGFIPGQELAPATRIMHTMNLRLVAPGTVTLDPCNSAGGGLPWPPRVVFTDGDVGVPSLSPGSIAIAPAPIDNDSCAEATLIPLGDTPFTTIGATDSPIALPGSCGFTTITDEVWYRFTAQCDGVLRSTVEGEGFVPRVAIYSFLACPESLTSFLDCAEGNPASGTSVAELERAVQQGDSFLLAIGHDGQGGGLGTISIACEPTGAYTLESVLLSPNPSASALFGSSIATSGDTLVISEPGNSDVAPTSGVVHIYERVGDDWALAQQLTHPTSLADARYGLHVDVDGEFLVVASHTPGNQVPFPTPEPVHVYQHVAGSWTLIQEIPPPPGFLADFGTAMDLDGDVLAIGGTASNQVAVYRRLVDFELEQTLTTSDPLQNQFGFSVAVSGDRILSGALSADGLRGRAYIFEHDSTSWSQTALLAPPDLEILDLFGSAVAWTETYALVSALGHDSFCPGAIPCETGAVYAFAFEGGVWEQVSKIVAQFPQVEDFFGSSITAIPGNVLAIGATDGAAEFGAIHIFEATFTHDWIPRQVITLSTPQVGVSNQLRCAASDAELFLGSPLHDEMIMSEGRVERYRRPLPPPGDEYVRSDCNGDGDLNIADAIFALSTLFPPPGSTPMMGCEDACDSNDDGLVNIADAITMLNSLFGSPPAVVPPPNTCGEDPTIDLLGCFDSGAACP